MPHDLPMAFRVENRRIVEVARNARQSGQHDDEDERGPPPDVENDCAGDAAVGRRHPGDMNAERGERHRDEPSLVGEKRDSEIADRHLEGEQRRADDRPKRARAGRAQIDQPSGEKAEDQFDRHGHHDKNHRDQDAVPELVGSENVDVVVEADKSGDALAHDIGREAVPDHRDQRQERECDDPDHGGEKQRVLERPAAFQSSNSERRQLVPPSLRGLKVVRGARPRTIRRALRRMTPCTAPSACRARSGR